MLIHTFRKWWPGIIIICLLAIFFNRYLFKGEVHIAGDILDNIVPWNASEGERHIKNPLLTDNVFTFCPWLLFVSDAIKKNSWPLWNPYIGCGTPYFVDAPYPFFYFLWGKFLPSPYDTFEITNIFILMMAYLFMYVFLRQLGLSRCGAVVGAISFTFNGYFMVWFMQHPPMFYIGAWLPLVFIIIHQMVRSKKIYYAILLGLIYSIQFLAGHYQTFFYNWLASLTYLLFCLRGEWKDKKATGKIAYYYGMALFILIGLCSIQIWPTAELIKLAVRKIINPQNVVYFPWVCALNIFTPNLFGNPVDHNYFGNFLQLFLFGRRFNYIETISYLGVFSVLLAIISVIYGFKKERGIKFFLMLAVGALVMALTGPFLSIFIKYIPILKTMSSTSRILYIFMFSCSILAGFGMEILYKNKINRASLKRIILVLFIIAMAFVISIEAIHLVLLKNEGKIIEMGKGYTSRHIYRKEGHPHELIFYQRQVSFIYSQLLEHFNVLNFQIMSPVVIVLLGIGAFYFLNKKKNKIFAGMVILLISGDLLYFGMRWNTTYKPNNLFKETEGIKFLKRQPGIFRVSGIMHTESLKEFDLEAHPMSAVIMSANLASIFGLHDIRGDNALLLRRYSELMNSIERDSVAEVNSHVFLGRRLTQYNSKLLDLLNIRFILCPPRMEIPEGKFAKVYDKEMAIYENKEVLPRAFAVSEFKIMKERKDILKTLFSPGFEMRKKILLEENPLEWEKGIEMKGKTESRDYEVRIVEYECKKIRISARMKENGFLVLSDMFYPGWRAYVDGVGKKIYCADYILRAVYLPKGDHEILFSYEPLSFKIGLFISLSTICLILACTFGIIMVNVLNRCPNKL